MLVDVVEERAFAFGGLLGNEITEVSLCSQVPVAPYSIPISDSIVKQLLAVGFHSAVRTPNCPTGQSFLLRLPSKSALGTGAGM